ncbi:MAG: hypothetical protein ACI4JA_01495 [Oscillospiraceae bacterium]
MTDPLNRFHYPGYQLTSESIRAQNNFSMIIPDYAEHLKDAIPITLTAFQESELRSKLKSGRNFLVPAIIFIVLMIYSIYSIITITLDAETKTGELIAPCVILLLSVVFGLKFMHSTIDSNEALESVEKGDYLSFQYTVTDMMWKVVSSSEGGYDKYFYISVNGVIVQVTEDLYMCADIGGIICGAVIKISKGEYLALFRSF